MFHSYFRAISSPPPGCVINLSVNTFVPCIWVQPVAGNGHATRLLARDYVASRYLYVAMSTWPEGNGHVTLYYLSFVSE